MLDCGIIEGKWLKLDSRWLAFKTPLPDLSYQNDLYKSDQQGSAKVSFGTGEISFWTFYNDLFEGPPLIAPTG